MKSAHRLNGIAFLSGGQRASDFNPDEGRKTDADSLRVCCKTRPSPQRDAADAGAANESLNGLRRGCAETLSFNKLSDAADDVVLQKVKVDLRAQADTLRCADKTLGIDPDRIFDSETERLLGIRISKYSQFRMAQLTCRLARSNSALVVV
jgi:hypothetical protein